MKIVLLESLGISQELLDSYVKPLKEKGYEFAAYERNDDPAVQIEEAKDADILIIANMPLKAEVINACPNLKYIDVAFTGVDHVALDAAKEKGIKVSCDLNYRKKLWTKEEAGKTMAKLMPYVNVCIANEEDAADVFNIHASGTDIESGTISKEGYIDVARQLKDRFGCSYVAITLRSSISATDNKWAGILFDGEQAYFSPEYLIHIVDRVGGGDSFGGGLIYALINEFSTQDAINYAVAASCLKHTIEHDFNLMSVDEVKALAAGNASGRVQR